MIAVHAFVAREALVKICRRWRAGERRYGTCNQRRASRTATRGLQSLIGARSASARWGQDAPQARRMTALSSVYTAPIYGC